MPTIELALSLFLAVALIGALAKWLRVPLPILQVACGIALSFVPALSDIVLDPDIFFLLFVPPLLFSDGWLFPKREFLNFLRPILLLAFGLVAATVIAVGYFMHWLVPGMPLAAAFALGAIVSPTDALATAAVTSRMPLPARVMHLVNGESLINDASGLVAFRFAVAAVATGAFSWLDAAGQLALLAGGGALAGIVVAALIGQLRRQLARFCIADPTIQTILSLLTPYAAYLAAEAANVSGILAVVTAGLYAGAHDARHLSIGTRRHSWEVWMMVLYIFNGLAFVLLGLQLPHVLRVPGYTLGELMLDALALYGVLMAVRLAWVYPGIYLPRLIPARILGRERPPPARAILLVGWAGIRGSVTLAAALSIPLAIGNPQPFPARDVILFLAGSTIVLTLAINGMTLPLLVRMLRLPPDNDAEREDRTARLAITKAGAEAVRAATANLRDASAMDYAQRVLADYEVRLARHSAKGERRSELEALDLSHRKLRLAGLLAERNELHSLRERHVINDETLRSIETDIDHAESLVRDASADRASDGGA